MFPNWNTFVKEQSVKCRYELAEEYADDDEDKDAIVKLRKRVLKRLRNQDNLISEWGFEPPKEIACGNATTKHTEFLLETASGKFGGEKYSANIVTPFEKTKLAAYTLSAISPYMRLYSFISKEIQALLDPQEESEHIYKKWLDSLSSDKFEASASRIKDLLEKLSVSLTGEELDVVERLYHRAMKLELEFIWSQSVLQQTIVPLTQLHNTNAEGNLSIFCDFDLTCTVVDSSSFLAELAIVSAANVSATETSSIASDEIRTTWANLHSQYAEEYQQCIESVVPNEDSDIDTSPQGLINYISSGRIFISSRKNSIVSRMVALDKVMNVGDILKARQKLSSVHPNLCKAFFFRLKVCSVWLVSTPTIKTIFFLLVSILYLVAASQ